MAAARQSPPGAGRAGPARPRPPPGIAAAADIEDGAGPRANRRGRYDRRPGNPNRKLAGLALGRDAEEALPLDGARGRDRILVAVPGAHVDEAVGEHRLGRDRGRQLDRPTGERLEILCGGCGYAGVGRIAAATVVMQIPGPGAVRC